MCAVLLAIETSCDECSASIVTASVNAMFVKVLSNVVYSQVNLHQVYGGVVPEIASRNHLEMLPVVIDQALKQAQLNFSDLSAIAVTNQPGLIGALLVGVSTAKTMAYTLSIPLVLVNHLEGHLHSLFIEGQPHLKNLSAENFPMLVCLVSGGHTNLYLIKDHPPGALLSEKLSESRDDAAGEAFDKCAKLLGLPYPGGLHLDQAARQGNPRAYAFPMPLSGNTLDFSFSGLKTAVALKLKTENNLTENKVADYSASIQEAIVQTLLMKVKLGLHKTNAKALAFVGGVSANSRLRELVTTLNVPSFFPSPQYCTDNAAMIGAAGWFQYQRGEVLMGKAQLKANA